MIIEFLDIQFYKLFHTASIVLKQLFTVPNFSLKIFFIFCAGAINALNPCSLGVLPVILYSLQDKNQLGQFWRWVAFTWGVFTAFICFFIVQQNANKYLSTFFPYQSILNIFFFISLGVVFLGFLPSISWASFSDDFLVKFKNKPRVTSYLLGLSLGLTVSSCTTPILFIVLAWLSYQEDMRQQVFYGASYSLGYTFPWLIALTMSSQFVKVFSSNFWSSHIFSAIGIYCVSAGTYQVLLLL